MDIACMKTVVDFWLHISIDKCLWLFNESVQQVFYWENTKDKSQLNMFNAFDPFMVHMSATHCRHVIMSSVTKMSLTINLVVLLILEFDYNENLVHRSVIYVHLFSLSNLASKEWRDWKRRMLLNVINEWILSKI